MSPRVIYPPLNVLSVAVHRVYTVTILYVESCVSCVRPSGRDDTMTILYNDDLGGGGGGGPGGRGGGGQAVTTTPYKSHGIHTVSSWSPGVALIQQVGVDVSTGYNVSGHKVT